MTSKRLIKVSLFASILFLSSCAHQGSLNGPRSKQVSYLDNEQNVKTLSRVEGVLDSIMVKTENLKSSDFVLTNEAAF